MRGIDDSGAKYIPTEDEIAAMCAEIRKGWKHRKRSGAKTPGEPDMESLSERVGACVGRCHGAVFYTAHGRVNL